MRIWKKKKRIEKNMKIRGENSQIKMTLTMFVVYGFSAGQMQNEAACETLEKVLGNTSDDCMVRHEVNSGPVLREVD